MSARNRVLQAALFVAAILVPMGTLLAQEVEEEPEAPAVVKTVIMSSGGGNVEAKTSGAPVKAGPFAPPSGGRPGRAGRPEGMPRPDGPPGTPGEKPSKPGEKPGKPGEDKGKSGDGKKKPDEGPKTVPRPSTPPEPADPEVIRKMKLGPDGKVRLNFTGHPWRDVLLWLARISGLSLDWQELPGDYLNLITQGRYDLDEVRDMINARLLARGFTMVRQGESLCVVKLEKLTASMVPRVEPEELDQRDPHEFVRVCFTLDWMVASEAVGELKPILGAHAKLIPLSTTNRVEAMDAVINLRVLRDFLKEEQSPEKQEEMVREFVLKHTRAEEIREQVLALLGMPSSGGSRRPTGSMNPQVMQQMQQQMAKQMQEQMKKMQQMAAQQAKKSGGGGGVPTRRQTQVSLIVNKRKNSILACAPPDKMVLIAQTITALDFPPGESDSTASFLSRTQVYRLETIDPEPVVKTLEELGNLDPRTRLEVDKENRLIIAHAGLLDHAAIQLLVNKLDGGGRRCHVIPLKRLRAESVVQTVTFILGGGGREEQRDPEPRWGYDSWDWRSRYRRDSRSSSDAFRIEADVKNNALVLWANEFEKAKVEELLDDLRKLPPKNGDGSTLHVYRLAAIDPEPVVKTLGEMGTLEPHTTLTVDEPNRAIIVTGCPADHEKIRKLLETLDGSARSFYVRHLRRLRAESVAGTIEFMFGGGEKKEQYQSRYDYYPYTDRMRPQGKDQADQFRVDADLEYNRLLMWATEIELEEVENLLAKLGEIPAEGGSPDTVRVLDTGGGAELEALIERIRRTWTSPNPLIVIPPEKPEETTPEEQSREPASPAKVTTTQATAQPLFRFAQLSREGAGGEVSQEEPAEGETGSEVLPPDAGKADGGSEVAPEPAKSAPGAEVASEPAKSAPGAEASPEPAKDAPVVKVPPDPGKGDPGTAVSPEPEKSAGKPPAPVRISWGPDGRVIIASDDPKALDVLEDILNRHAPPRRDYKVFPLKYAVAYWVARNLEDFFEEEEEGGGRNRYYDPYWGGYRYSGGTGDESRARLSKRQPVKFIADDDTNTILVQNADPGQLKTIDELIKLYDMPEPPDTQSVRKTEIVLLKYAKAQVVEKALKDVYRDLLSSNDKALREGQPRPERSVTYNFGESGVTKMPRWKGQLSIGIDEFSNALIVSAPGYLFDDVKARILELDEAARPVSTVRVLKVDGRLSAAGLQQKLAEIMGQGGGRRPPTAGRPPSSSRRPPSGPPRSRSSRGRSSSSRGSYNSR